MNLKHKVIISNRIYSILTIQKKKSYEIQCIYTRKRTSSIDFDLSKEKRKVIANYCFNHKLFRHYKPHREIYLHPPKIKLNIYLDFK
jgi:hypothetical protein